MSTTYQIQLTKFNGDEGSAANRTDSLFSSFNRELKNNSKNNVIEPFFNEVIFDVSPTISESRTANYTDAPLPGASGIVVYETTANRRFSISSRFVSRTVSEALRNYRYVNLLRSWMVPQGDEGLFGKPPILRLNGYRQQFFNIPVVVSEMSVNYPEDVDYIDAEDENVRATVPIIQTVEVSLIESHNILKSSFKGLADEDALKGRSNANQEFNLERFKKGTLPGY